MGFTPKRKSQGPSPIGAALKKFFDGNTPQNLSEEQLVFGAWPKAVGSDISRKANPASFRNGILFVETRHPVWTTELNARRHHIQKKLNEAMGKEVVREIHFRLAKF